MIGTYKILGQVFPVASTLTSAYVVPAGTAATIEILSVCNQNPSASANFRVSIAAGGASDTPAQYIYFDLPIENNDTFFSAPGMTLAATDVIRVYSDQPNLSFQIFGLTTSNS